VSNNYQLSYANTINLQFGYDIYSAKEVPIYFQFSELNLTGYKYRTLNKTSHWSMNIDHIRLNLTDTLFPLGNAPLVLPTTLLGFENWIDHYAELLNLIRLSFSIESFYINNLQEILSYGFNISFTNLLIESNFLFWIEPYFFYFRELFTNTGRIGEGYIKIDVKYNKVSGILEELEIMLIGFNYQIGSITHHSVNYYQKLIFAIVLPFIAQNPIDGFSFSVVWIFVISIFLKKSNYLRFQFMKS
jgi:hypothetical protein